MGSACHCSVQAGELLWLLVQASMYSLLNVIICPWLGVGHSSLELKVTASFMQLHLVLGQVSPGQQAAVRLPWDAPVLFLREKIFLVTIPGHITSGVCFWRDFPVSTSWVWFSAVELPQGACTQFLNSKVSLKKFLKLSSFSEAFNPQDWGGSGLLWNSQMHVLWMLGRGWCSVSFSRFLGSAELP